MVDTCGALEIPERWETSGVDGSIGSRRVREASERERQRACVWVRPNSLSLSLSRAESLCAPAEDQPQAIDQMRRDSRLDQQARLQPLEFQGRVRRQRERRVVG